MWIYVQRTGDFFQNSTYIETGYSGKLPEGKNDPAKECVRDIGPIPRGYYTINAAVNSPTVVSLPLVPDTPNYCQPPRSGFLIHGDNSTGTASTGCIILTRSTRERVTGSNDKRLRVVADSVRSERVSGKRYAEKLELK